MLFPFLNKEPHIAIDESRSHKLSLVGKREVETKFGHTASEDPLAVLVHALRKVLNAAPSRILCEIHKPMAIPAAHKDVHLF